MQNAIVNLTDKIMGRNPVSTGRTRPLVSDEIFMHALTWHGSHDMRYERVGQPIISEPDDVLIKVTSTAPCGSDLHVYNGEMPGIKTGDILGHEFMGFIVEKGPNVRLPLGSRVVVSSAIACGFCSYCKKGQFSACDTTNGSKLTEQTYGSANSGVFGLGHLNGDYTGGQAEFVRVPFADVNCLPVPAELPDEKVLFLSDIVPTSYHACRMVKEGDVVGIWGMGPVGLLAARWCQFLGAKRVIGISGTQYRLDFAREKLGIETLNYKDHGGDIVKALQEIAPDGLDCAIDATAFRFAKGYSHKMQRAIGLESDSPETITECMTALKKFGSLCIIGSYAGTANNFPVGFIFMKHLTVTAGVVPVQKLWGYCLDKIIEGSFDPTFVITHKMSLRHGPDAFRMMNEHENGYIKGIMHPESPGPQEDGGAHHEGGERVVKRETVIEERVRIPASEFARRD